MDLLRAIRKRKKGTKISEIQKNIVRTNQNLLLFFESYYLVISYLKAYRFSRGALKIDRFLLTFHIWETRVSESRDPKRGVPSVSNDVDRLRVRKFEGKFCFEFVRVLLRVSPHQFIQPRGKLQT